MKRVCVLLLLAIGLLIPACSSQAVQLEQGSYVRFEYVMLEGHWIDGQGNSRIWSAEWLPTSSLGQSASLSVAEGTNPSTHGRTVTITENTTVAPGVLFEDIGSFNVTGSYYDWVEITWETSYDASKMQLQIWRKRPSSQDELVWRQTQSNLAYGYGNIWNSAPVLPGDSVVFRLVAVPEPSALLTLSCGLVACLSIGRSRKGGRR
jgi:hypothetical protein